MKSHVSLTEVILLSVIIAFLIVWAVAMIKVITHLFTI